MKRFKFLKRKRNIWIAVILVAVIVIGFLIFRGKNNTNSIQVGFATKQNLEETVLATGQVVSETDLSLSFQSSGVVRRVSVKEGDKAYQGQVLASIDQSGALATLTSAKGSLAQAQANYEKLLAGETQQSIQVVKDSINLAQQDLDNSYGSALTSLRDAYIKIYNSLTLVNSIQNSYFSTSDQQGIKFLDNKNNINEKVVNFKIYLDKAIASSDKNDIDIALTQGVFTLNSVANSLKIIREVSDEGIYYSKISATDKATIDTQRGYINTALTNIIGSQQTINSYKIAFQKSKNQLSVTTAPPTQADVDLSRAQILSAEGQVASAQAVLNNLIIVAPTQGIITKVDIRVGEQSTPSKEVIVLQDVGNLHTEADVSEANVASLQLGQSIDYTFDALGPDRHFQGKVLTINPASTIISGVVNYKVTGNLDNIPNIKPGMTANMTILVAKKDNVLAIPSTAVINKNNKQYVKVIDDSKKKTYHEVQVQTGLQADGGLIEVVSGLEDRQEIITYIKP